MADGRPIPEYKAAFDTCAQRAYGCGGDVLLLMDEAIDRNALQDRLPHAIAYRQNGLHQPVKSLIWAFPQATEGQRFRQALTLLQPSGRLYVIVPGRLWRLLPGLRTLRTSNMGQREVVDLLHGCGCQLIDQLGFHGIESLSWGIGYRVSRSLRRDDLADRYRIRSRQTYVNRGPMLSTLVLLEAIHTEGSVTHD